MAKGKKTGGRKPGSTNKRTTAVKAALVDAFEQLGGVPALVRWGKKDPGEFYRIWSRLLPTEIKNADGEPFRVGIVEQIVTATGGADADDKAGRATVPAAGAVLS